MSDSPESPITEIYAIFHGHVQGVGFRATTRHHAALLNLKGTVRNRSDGTVEAYLQGSEKQIQELFETLNRKHQIFEISKTTLKELHTFNNFTIIH